MALRQVVFTVEQNCAFLDADGKDKDAWHLMGIETDPLNPTDEGTLVAYTRLLPKDVSYSGYASIGRVVNAPQVRGKGVGKILMQESIKWMNQLFPNDPVKIGAQTYLLDFYSSFGFVPIGDEYIEDGIPHILMILKK